MGDLSALLEDTAAVLADWDGEDLAAIEPAIARCEEIAKAIQNPEALAAIPPKEGAKLWVALTAHGLATLGEILAMSLVAEESGDQTIQAECSRLGGRLQIALADLTRASKKRFAPSLEVGP
jgi:hypothetical protein